MTHPEHHITSAFPSTRPPNFKLGGVFLIAFIFSLPSCVLAQKYSRWITRGDAAYNSGEYQQAIVYYDWAASHSSDWKANLGIAQCYRALMDYPRAREYYAKIVNEPMIPVNVYFHYAQSLMACKDYAAAKQWFEKYAQIAPHDPRAEVFRDLDRLVEAVMRDSAAYEIQRLPINSKFSDFSPVFYKNGILFSSARPNEFGVIHTSTLNDAPLLDVYFAAPDTNGKWSKPKPFDALNSPLNEGPLAIDNLTGNIFLTRNDPNHRKNRSQYERHDINRLEIDAFTMENGILQPKGPLPFNNPRYAVGHPALSPDGKQLYFASNMPGGFGGTDLYVTNWTEKGWSLPNNLGPNINTAENELFPFIDAKSQLYFASNGHLGLGGLDLFYVGRTGKGEWAKVQNLGYPLNSQTDDFGLILAQDGNSGYFCSNRNCTPQDDDIYAFTSFWPRFECSPQIKNNYCYQFWETGVIDSDSIPLAYEWDFGDGFKARGLRTGHCYAAPGTYRVKLDLVDTLSGFLFLSQSDYMLQVNDTEQVFIDCPDRVGAGEEFLISGAKSTLEGCAIEQYYWETGDGRREKIPSFKHQYLLPGKYEIHLGVVGTPDENGNLLCRQCVSKQIEVMPLPAMERYRDSIAAEIKHLLEVQSKWKHPELVDELLRSGKKEYDLREGSKYKSDPPKGEATHSEDLPPMPRKQAPLPKVGALPQDTAGPADQARIPENHISPPTISRPPKRISKIPSKQGAKGTTAFSGVVTDTKGLPIANASFTLEAIGSDAIVFQSNTDTLGQVKFSLPNGYKFQWNVEKSTYFPEFGTADLSASQHPTEIKVSVKLNQVEEAMASGNLIRIENIYFDFDQADLRSESNLQLNKLARIMIDHPEYGVVVTAHTDDRGNDAYNLDLSRRRAYSVLKYLILVGYDVGHIKSEGFGESRPALPNTSDENRQFNRRVEFQFYPLESK